MKRNGTQTMIHRDGFVGRDTYPGLARMGILAYDLVPS